MGEGQKGLITYYVLFFIKIGSREVNIAGVMSHLAQRYVNTQRKGHCPTVATA